MKIGILTFHEIYNPGAYLQAYSTLLLLRELGHDPHIINYTAPNHRFRPWKQLLRRPHGVLMKHKKWVDSFIRNKAFSDVHYKLSPTRKLFSHGDLLNEQFDVILVGSDIVWNYQSKNWGDDTAYFGHDLNCDKLIAYAASCGPLDLNLPAPQFVREGLALFDAISVRDQHTANMVTALTGNPPEIVVDPTFHLDLTSITLLPCKHREPYLLVYAIPQVLSQSAINAVTFYASQKNLTIISICYRNDWADINVIGATPFEWLSYIKSASCVFTNTFHGTIFCIMFNKRFASQLNKLTINKTEYLLSTLGLDGHIVSLNTQISNVFDAVPDYSAAYLDIDVLVNKNISFLTNALG